MIQHGSGHGFSVYNNEACVSIQGIEFLVQPFDGNFLKDFAS
jgi:hypothetical protein